MLTDEQQEILELFAMWRGDGLEAMTRVVGFSDLLLDGGEGPLNKNQHEDIELIHANGQKAIDLWNFMDLYLRLHFDAVPSKRAPINLLDVIDRVRADLWKEVQIDNIDVDIPETLPLIKGNNLLHAVFFYLINNGLPLNLKNNLSTKIKARAIDGWVAVELYRGIKLSDNQYGESSPLFHRGSRLAAVEMIIQQYGGQISTHLIDDGTMFCFTLPIWVGSEYSEENL